MPWFPSRPGRPRRLAGPRLRLTVLGATALLMCVVTLPAAAVASTGAAVVTAAASPATAVEHSVVAVSGSVGSTAGRTVLLQRRLGSHWRTVSRQATGPHGQYTFRLRAPGARAVWLVRVLAPAAGRTIAATGHTLVLRVTDQMFRITAATAAMSVPTGTAAVLSGQVQPAAAGTVTVQVLHGGAWRALAAARLIHSRFLLRTHLPAGRYPLRVVKTFTATIAGGHSAPMILTVTAAPGMPPAPPVAPVAPVSPPGVPAVAVTSPDTDLLALPTPRLVFSQVQTTRQPQQHSLTFTNPGTAPVTVTALSITGPDAASYTLPPGQRTSLTLPAGGQADVPVDFAPTAPTNCPTAANPYPVSGDTRDATLTFTSTDPHRPTGSVALSGLISCDNGGASEPTWDQVAHALGYTDVVVPPGASDHTRRFLGYGVLAGTDEVSAPYFQAADPTRPVTLTPLAHYESASTVPAQATGWYPRGATMTTNNQCSTACRHLWDFPADPSTTSYNQNEKLLPGPIGTTSFTPNGPFGLFTGDGSNVNYSDDTLNVAHNTTGADLTPKQTLHDLRIYPAYGPGRVAIADTYLIAVDVSRVPANKNLDYQDVVMILTNAQPAA